MNQRIDDVLGWLTVGPSLTPILEWTPNEWHGADALVDREPTGTWVIRLASEFEDPEEEVTLYVLWNDSVMLWEVGFAAGVPVEIVRDTVRSAIGWANRSTLHRLGG